MIKSIKKRIQSDDGASITILTMGIIIMLLFMSLFFIEVSKDVYVRNSIQNNAQKSVETAIKEQDLIGGLKPEAMAKAQHEYLELRQDLSGSSGNNSLLRSGPNGETYPKFRFRFKTRRGATDETEMSRVYTTTGDKPVVLSREDERKFITGQYQDIIMEVTDCGQNFFFSMFGQPTQEFVVRASAISSGSRDYID